MDTSLSSIGPLFDFDIASCYHTYSYRLIKRLADMICSFVGLLFLIPLLVAIAVTIKLTSPGPVLYRWHVVGRAGQRFTGYKFRTMVVNADALKQQLWQHNERGGPTFKMQNDPRVTRIGRFLRKYSLDELPQLWSVLKGDMSLIGPRPVGPTEWPHFEHWQRRKLSVTPGGICLWHVRGKPKDFTQWVKLDLEYIDNWSLSLDLNILCAGVWHILSGKNY